MAIGIESFVLSLRETGFVLVLLWVLSLAIVWGLLHHANIPKSVTARGVIAIAASFLVLLAAAATPAVAFLENLITASVLIAFGLLVLIIVLELAGVKGVFTEHSKFFAAAIIVLITAIFVGAGGLNVVGLPSIEINQAVLAFVVFIGVMIVTIFLFVKESGGKP